jgi:hypothetical protein
MVRCLLAIFTLSLSCVKALTANLTVRKPCGLRAASGLGCFGGRGRFFLASIFSGLA